MKELPTKEIREGMKIINGDCMEVMKQYEDNYFDLCIVDPPYGSTSDATKTFTSNSKNKATKRAVYKQFKNTEPPTEYFEELIRVSRHQIIWGVNFYNNFNLSGGRLCWDKKGTAFGRAELAYLSMTRSVNICEFIWNGMIQGDMKNKEQRIHPTQKPVKLYNWIYKNYAQEGQKILDTHLGSGSNAISAHYAKMGEFVGVELDEDYYKSACERIKKETMQLELF